MRQHAIVLGAALLLACGGAGMGADVRNDIETQMAKIQQPVSDCYEAALKRDRKLKGRMVVSARAEAKTGVFKDVSISENELKDDELELCVREHVGSLKLQQPQKTQVSVNYPLEFAPSN